MMWPNPHTTTTEKTPNPWPLGGYAPGGYLGTCSDCGRVFEGDKRARQCLECAVHDLQTLAADLISPASNPVTWHPADGAVEKDPQT